MNTIEIIDGICVITIDNPLNNYISRPEFIPRQKLEDIFKNNICKGILITSSGRHFSAGADISELYKMVLNDSIDQEISKGKELINYLLNLNIPVVSAVEGVCFGAGLEIVLNSDIKIGSEKALFAFPEINHELIPGLTGNITLKNHTGKSKAMEIILGADVFDAKTATKFSIIDYLVKPKTTKEFGMELLKKMTYNKPLHLINKIVKLIRNKDNKNNYDLLKDETEFFCQAAKKLISSKKNA